MVTIVFHEKSGCATNARQKAALLAAGNVIEARDLRDTEWDEDHLFAFLGTLPVAQWFNRNAPAVKNGEIHPDLLSASSALQLLRENPLLIRRPLLEIHAHDGIKLKVGFDPASLAEYLTETALPPDSEACSHSHKPCPSKPQPAAVSTAMRDRAEAAYLGLAIGDALGATVEFMTPAEIRAQYGTHREIVGGGWLHLKPGAVTDDTGMALALGDALIAGNGSIDAKRCAESFVAWMQSKPVDIGNTIRRNLNEFRRTGIAEASPSVHDAGNGAAMRLLPSVLVTLAADRSRMAEAVLIPAHVTHHNAESDAACLFIANCIRDAIEGIDMRTLYRRRIHPFLQQHPVFDFYKYRNENPSGYIVHTLRSVLHALLRTDSFESCLIDIVNRGGDSDTTAAIAGMIAGPLYGLSSLPRRWLAALDKSIADRCRSQCHVLLELNPITNSKELNHAAL